MMFDRDDDTTPRAKFLMSPYNVKEARRTRKERKSLFIAVSTVTIIVLLIIIVALLHK